jgi:RNA polymerase sigma-70 factor (ECF subfamily)
MEDREVQEHFTALFDRYFPQVWAYAVSRAGKQLAEEVVSQTFAVAWRRRAGIPSDPLPWLLGVSRNLVRESQRATLRRESMEAELQTWTSDQVEPDVAESVVERAVVLRALASLSEGDRELLTLVAWHGLSSRDASRVLGCSRPAFFVRLHRARGRLEDAVRLCGSDPAPGQEGRPGLVSRKEVSQ